VSNKPPQSQLESRLRDVAPEELIRRPAPEKWSIAEIVAHLADAELAMGGDCETCWRIREWP
jgi:DinB superfamily